MPAGFRCAFVMMILDVQAMLSDACWIAAATADVTVALLQVTTGSGLPAGPAGILGAAEGWSYLSLVLAIAATGAQAIK